MSFRSSCSGFARGRLASLLSWGAPLVAAAVLVAGAPCVRAAAPTFAVASETAPGTAAAIEQLRRGGSAIDAAVTAALVGGVVNSSSSGIGGGGFAVVWDAAEQRARVLDFRETAPKAIDAPAFEQRPFDAGQRGRWVGVPGEVLGLSELHRAGGKLTWQQVVEPAVTAARDGFPVGEHLARVAKLSARHVSADAPLRAWLLPGGKPISAGSTLRSPALASTLARIAAEGPAAFYSGPVATDLVEATRAAGGALTLEDLRDYRPVWRQPLSVSWEGNAVFTMPPPSAGGLMLVQALKTLRSDELRAASANEGHYVHLLAEVMRAAIADRMKYVGDPAFQEVDLSFLLDAQRLARRRATMSADRTRPLTEFRQEEHGTHHLVAWDASGNVVSLTTTVNRGFGAKLTAPRSGVLLNDELDDFTTAETAAVFGVDPSPNRPRPGARPVSSMTPTIVVRGGKPVLAIGGSGGMTIATNVTQAALARLALGRAPQDVVTAERFSIPTDGATLEVAASASDALLADLRARGEVVERRKWEFSAVQLVAVEGNSVVGAADPRKHGSAMSR